MPRLRPILLSLLCGLIITLASAWALAAWAPINVNSPATLGAQRHFMAGGRAWQVTEHLAPGIQLNWWMELSEVTLGAPRTGSPATPEHWLRRVRSATQAQRRAAGLPLTDEDSPPNWGTFHSSGSPEDLSAGADLGFGWPLPALWYRVNGTIRVNAGKPTGIDGGILLTARSKLSLRRYDFRALPLYPIWHGLLLNTLLFAAALWLPFSALPSARRALRTRRGRCPKCAYDLRGLTPGQPCPECGPATEPIRP